jgi:hypothetical protein
MLALTGLSPALISAFLHAPELADSAIGRLAGHVLLAGW